LVLPELRALAPAPFEAVTDFKVKPDTPPPEVLA
jgi:hypothetical protein